MTLEERAEEYLDKTVHTLNTGDEIGMAKVLAEFARQEIKAKLEEAADNSAGIIFRNCLRNVPSEFQDETHEYTKKKFEMLRESITKTPLDYKL